MLSILTRGSTRAVLVRAGLLIAAIALADWRVEENIPLGFLYLFPMLLVGSAASRFSIAATAALCTCLTELFDTFEWSPALGLPRDILIFAAFFCMGLFVYEVTRSRKISQSHLQLIEREVQARREAEEQLKILVESSPAAIFTMGADGSILLANDAAHRLLALEAGSLPGRQIGAFLPALATALAPGDAGQAFRTVMQCRGHRADGEVFLADVWFSTYRTTAGTRLAAMVVDTSEELRNREEFSLHQLLAGSRILVGAVSHEIRNVCGAIAVVHANLARGGALAGSKDFEALGTLILALEKIAAMDLRQTANQASGVDLAALLEEFRIVVDPSCREDGIETRWEVESSLPPVWADRQSLMQVFLNLTKNSERAMLGRPTRCLTVSARREDQIVSVRFRDTGGGVLNPDRLFRPFQQDAQSGGLGLYLSRAFMRSFRGDLRYEPEPGGASFIVEMAPVIAAEKDTHDSDLTGGRSRPVPREPEPVAPRRA